MPHIHAALIKLYITNDDLFQMLRILLVKFNYLLFFFLLGFRHHLSHLGFGF